MSPQQITILVILAVTIALFLWGRWRHDMVALASLLLCVFAGLVPAAGAFAGFGHPAVVTVACVLILSRGLLTSGAVDVVTRKALPHGAGPWTSVAALVVLAAVLSAFMNNVGALALLMPVAIQMARKHELPPGMVLMPLAFGSILGGMTTLIGTPPNLIVSGFRQEAGLGSFAMFDFAPVGVAIAATGLLFVIIFARWLIPARQRAGAEGFDTGRYLTEARVTSDAKAVDMTLRQLEKALEASEAQFVSLVRNKVRVPAPGPARRIRLDDILVIEAEPDALAAALNALGLKLEADRRNEDKKKDDKKKDDKKTEDKSKENESADKEKDDTGEIVLLELVVMPGSRLIGRNARSMNLRTRYDINLLAVSRQGRRSLARLRSINFQASDVLLLQGPPDALQTFASDSGCVPLADRELRLPRPREAVLAGTIMLGAVIAASFGLVPAAVAFAAGVLVAVVTRVVPPRQVYDAVDWPVIVLLAALIPVAGALASTGTADLIANVLLNWVAQGYPVIVIGLILVLTMTLSDFMNNAATAAVMSPIAISAALGLGVSPDPFLMAVAVGASCAFLTPIGHQNNTLILGPGGFRFGDYWRLGLPLEVIVVALGVPMILLVWPLVPAG